MPSETIIPGFTVVIVLFIATASIIGVIITATTMAVNTIRLGYVEYYERMTRISIVEVNLTYLNSVLEGTIRVYNYGPLAIYRLEACDLVIEYYSISGVLKTLRLTYETHWYIEKIILAGDYSIEFSDHPIIGEGETGLIRVYVSIVDIDVEKPLRVVFTTQYGTSDSKWVILNA
jgi:hypothetical protein